MEYKIRESNGVTIVDLNGRLSLGEAIAFGPGSGTSLRDVVPKLLKEGKRKILLNLKDVNYIDSSGIGDIITAYSSTRNQGGELRLASPSPQVRDLFQITKLYTILDVSDDETTALKGFQKAGQPSTSVA
ncbi:MAG TPA: STAS domain-containing protein [Terriglobales bacterium]|nr:STAS domain-containing protein [Terriglobales bacterium]